MHCGASTPWKNISFRYFLQKVTHLQWGHLMWHLSSDRQRRHKLTVQWLRRKPSLWEVAWLLRTHQQIDMCLHWRNTWDIQSGQKTAQEHCSGWQICVISGQMSKPFKFQINFPAENIGLRKPCLFSAYTLFSPSWHFLHISPDASASFWF